MEADGGGKGSMWPMVQGVVPHGRKVLGTGAGYIVSAVEKQRMRGVWDQLTSFFFMGFGTPALGIGLPYLGEASCKLPNQDNYSQVWLEASLSNNLSLGFLEA